MKKTPEHLFHIYVVLMLLVDMALGSTIFAPLAISQGSWNSNSKITMRAASKALCSLMCIEFGNNAAFKYDDSEQLCHMMVKRGRWLEGIRGSSFQGGVDFFLPLHYWKTGKK